MEKEETFYSFRFSFNLFKQLRSNASLKNKTLQLCDLINFNELIKTSLTFILSRLCVKK